MDTPTAGNCYICGVELGKTAMKNHVLKTHGKQEGGQACRLIKIEGAYDKDCWLFIDVPVERTLSDIDTFLRKIWLECCGHMSAFRSPKRSEYSEIPESRSLYYFSIGDKIMHDYDFGSTTSTLITFVGDTTRTPQRDVVRLLARNVPAKHQCADCGAPADYICMECAYDYENPFYCDECSEKHDHDDMLLPVANSPRMGVCGYGGEQDTFTFIPGKTKAGDGK